jgi:hypothetical protein
LKVFKLREYENFPKDFMGPQITEVGKLISVLSPSALKHFLMFFPPKKRQLLVQYLFLESPGIIKIAPVE